ncbi:MAG TPA: ABC transporter ATP-binding protein [Methanospirillum sp.]|uniref:ABC transporter ATP-binding protein n=1 Tax=Methanospirillum sp. TaxID=45200 RepID=UPI002C8D67EA|nr:ABC transporter ATP-binding protein [Methanospirillum sp.]HWQ64090.1 ABC transporter ATP-binding protein [Methanospirillum sp.]
MNKKNILQVDRLSVWFRSGEREVCTVSDFSLTLAEGETVAIIGESGCGKSVAAHAIVRILPGSARIQGRIIIDGLCISEIPDEDMDKVRGDRIAILFQSPDRSLNPLYRIKRQIIEPLKVHHKSADQQTIETILCQAGCNPSDIMSKYPCQCSGGMNQRALLAIVSGLNSKVVIMDEPTKGLDYDRVKDVQLSLEKIQSNMRGIILISHDISFVRNLSTRIMVMYAGEVIEAGLTSGVLTFPRHPYTKSLLKSLPENGFIPIPGMAPALSEIPNGCRFSPRCTMSDEHCNHFHPDLVRYEEREVRCHRC